MSDLLYGRAGPEELRDPDFPALGTVRYELHKSLDGYRCCIKRSEVVGIFESREDARQWMIENYRRAPDVRAVYASPRRGRRADGANP